MKILILEGCDNVGKTSLIANLVKQYNTKYNIVICHCGKPLPGVSQQIFFTNQYYYIKDLYNISRSNNKETLLIYDRFVIGEYVWGTMYRNGDLEIIKNSIVNPTLEKIINIVGIDNIVHVLLVADSHHLYMNDDGNSYASIETKNEFIDKIDKQQKLFIDCISNPIYNATKYLIYDVEDGLRHLTFLPEDKICNDIVEYLTKNNF